MSNLDGQILFALIAALLLAWLCSALVAKRYADKVLALMLQGPAPNEETAAPVILHSAPLTAPPAPSGNPNLQQQNRRARLQLHLALAVLSLIFAAVIAMAAQTAYTEDGFGLRRFLTLTLVYAWPWVPTAGLLERWTRWKIFCMSLLYVVLSGGVVMLNSTDNQAVGPVLFWLFSQQLPLLLIVFFITGPKLRSTGPYLISVFFILSVSTVIGWHALEHSITQDGSAGWVVDLSLLSNAYVVFALFGIAPWLIAFFPVRYLAKKLAGAYRRKAFSEPLYLAAGLWTIALLFQSLTLSHALGFAAYGLMGAVLLLPIFNRALRPVLRPTHQPPTLLLLRVFRGDDSIEALFNQVIERWRYSGNTLLIAGKDLALRNLEPDELFRFLSGRLEESFVANSARLQTLLSNLDFSADADGRFRINEFFCFDSTWKMVLETLVDQADRVLMDLRGYTTERQGCSHELSVLASKPHLKKLLILFDKNTDRAGAESLLTDSRLAIDWIDSEKSAQQTAAALLPALLS